ncbi:type I pantothenate kinase [Sandarakinorhabdus cyanobacteriorum]|uniref:Type I pantothenate kinase n=1 Tax=Sandarakinorhabdus cyanobacteriorum TaxID=1981098 RepID=A0A255YJ44_9SPHN|nr:type I pantothenate kinase [Sandarakinorhabdus cyanobacteriorum]OYQ28694.1 type I pantothenate kinase [Sandarakinorhabdus cyanobacteriorum]
MTPITPAALATRLAAACRAGETLVAGITGSVAVGKTTLARQIAEHLPGRVEIVSTDGFLLPNAVLEPAGLLMRKGFPESYDHQGMAAAITGLKRLAADGPPVTVPAYSHALYDIDPAGARQIAAADVVLVEGLGLAPADDGRRPPLDLLLYIDADEPDVRHWFVERFIGLWAAAADDPTSFYARFRSMTEAEARAFAVSVWEGVNLPNWQQHIVRARAVADVVVKKTLDHSLMLA